jgi:lipopolysaccharide export system permease protein
MTSITRYILLQTLGPFLFVTATLTGVVWLTQSLRFLDLIINKGLSVGGFLYLTLLLLPGFLTVVLPIAGFIAVLYVYFRLDSDSELVVMRSAGLGPAALMGPAVMMATGVAALTYLLSLYLMPLGFRTFKDMQFVVRNNYASVLIQEGTFSNLIDGVTVYVRERRGGGDLRGILVHDSRDPKRPVTMMAEHGALIMSSDGPRFVMANGNRQELEPNRRQLSLLYFENYVLDLGHLAQSPSNRWREASERYIHELFDPGDTLDDINQADKLRAEGHRRIVLPLYAIVLAMIAVTSIIAGPSSRRGQLYRATIAAVFAVVFEIVGLVLLPLVEMAPSLAILMYLHVVIVAAGCIYLMGRRLSRRPPSNQFAEAGT